MLMETSMCDAGCSSLVYVCVHRSRTLTTKKQKPNIFRSVKSSEEMWNAMTGCELGKYCRIEGNMRRSNSMHAT